MESAVNFATRSRVSLIFALISVFCTRRAIFLLFAGCLIGVIMMGYDTSTTLFGLDSAGSLVRLIAASLDGEFIRICVIIIFIGILFELFKRAGVLVAFTKKVSKPEHQLKK